MWAIHIIGLPFAGKSIIAKGLYDQLRPFLGTLGVNTNLVEMENVVREWQAPLQKAANGTIDINYTDFEPEALRTLLLSRIDPKGVNIIAGAKERFLLNVGSENYHPLNLVVGVRAYSGVRLGRAGLVGLDALSVKEKNYGAFPFSGTFESMVEYVIDNNGGDATAEVRRLVSHIFSIATWSGLKA